MLRARWSAVSSTVSSIVSSAASPAVSSLTSSAAASLVAVSLALLTACPSSSPAKGSQVPSEMLGPTDPSSTSGGAAAAAAPSAAGPASEEESLSGGAGATAASDPAAPAAPLSAAEQKTLDEMRTLMRDVTKQFEQLVGSLEQAGADCKKAATALSTSHKGSAAIDQKMTAFKARLQAGPQPSPALMEQLRETTLAAFPADVRARAETTFDRLEKQCANDAEFQRAKSEAAAAQGPS